MSKSTSNNYIILHSCGAWFILVVAVEGVVRDGNFHVNAMETAGVPSLAYNNSSMKMEVDEKPHGGNKVLIISGLEIGGGMGLNIL